MAKSNKIIKTGLALLLVWALVPKANAAASNGNQNDGIPQGGVAPGAPAGSMDESFLGTDNVPGVANNNPGNIKWTPDRLNDPWEGAILWENNTDGVFEQYARLADGTRAMIKLLHNYIDDFGRNTPKKIIQFWSVGNPNYVSFVVNRTGFGENQVLTPDKPTLKALVQAMSRLEIGYDFITDQRFENGWQLFSN